MLDLKRNMLFCSKEGMNISEFSLWEDLLKLERQSILELEGPGAGSRSWMQSECSLSSGQLASEQTLMFVAFGPAPGRAACAPKKCDYKRCASHTRRGAASLTLAHVN